jgi:hypothetical protein
MAYLMSAKGYTYDEALNTLRTNRSVVALNKGFEAQLRAYGDVKCDVYAAHQLQLRQRIALFSAFLRLKRSSRSIERRCESLWRIRTPGSVKAHIR